jgi:hypothetical protein
MEGSRIMGKMKSLFFDNLTMDDLYINMFNNWFEPVNELGNDYVYYFVRTISSGFDKYSPPEYTNLLYILPTKMYEAGHTFINVFNKEKENNKHIKFIKYTQLDYVDVSKITYDKSTKLTYDENYSYEFSTVISCVYELNYDNANHIFFRHEDILDYLKLSNNKVDNSNTLRFYENVAV